MKRAGMLVALALAVGLAGCTDPIAAERAKLQPLVGQTENVLIATMGVPVRSIATNGMTYLAYDRQRLVIIPGRPPFAPPYGPGWATSAWYDTRGYYPQQQIVQVCEATFAVSKGVVVNFTVRGDGC